MGNFRCEKLTFSEWVDEYVLLLKEQGKLGEAILEARPLIDLDEIPDVKDQVKILSTLYRNSDFLDMLSAKYYDYLKDHDTYHLVDPNKSDFVID